MELLAVSNIDADELGAAPRALRGEVFEADDGEAYALMNAGLAVAAHGPDAALQHDARVALVGYRRE